MNSKLVITNKTEKHVLTKVKNALEKHNASFDSYMNKVRAKVKQKAQKRGEK